MRRALVTGGAKGIGLAIVHGLLASGHYVSVVDRDAAGLRALSETFPIETIEIDLADTASVADALAGRGEFDVVVNNAGIDQHAFFTKTAVADWRILIAVNLEAVLAVTHATLPAMRERGWGRIINIASEAGRLGSRGGSVYAAAKAGVIGFTRSIAREVADHGVTANVVAPGPIETPLLHQAVAAKGKSLAEAMREATLMKRLGTPNEVAAAVSFLASDGASYITGEVLGVSGGMGCGA